MLKSPGAGVRGGGVQEETCNAGVPLEKEPGFMEATTPDTGEGTQKLGGGSGAGWARSLVWLGVRRR